MYGRKANFSGVGSAADARASHISGSSAAVAPSLLPFGPLCARAPFADPLQPSLTHPVPHQCSSARRPSSPRCATHSRPLRLIRTAKQLPCPLGHPPRGPDGRPSRISTTTSTTTTRSRPVRSAQRRTRTRLGQLTTSPPRGPGRTATQDPKRHGSSQGCSGTVVRMTSPRRS